MKVLTKIERRRKRIRSKIFGTVERPRVSVFRSNTSIYAQVIDDKTGETLVAIHTKNVEGKNPTERAKQAGKLLAEKAKEKKITKIVFDRGGYLFGGKIKALAEGLREGGLEF
ncbi:MAG: 50S ribosomal protein L18 [Candidatus Paceibacterota bacterium]|nr:MAG: 50S ribosomal protein L18 [Candidatus Paceibacterota bacterium]